MTLNRELTHDAHVHFFTVTRDLDGWAVCEQEDAVVLRAVHHDDWHRVERDSMLFDLKALTLKTNGWIEH